MECMRRQSPGGMGRTGVRRCDYCGRKSIIQHITDDGKRLCPQCSAGHTDQGFLKKLTDAINVFKK